MKDDFEYLILALESKRLILKNEIGSPESRTQQLVRSRFWLAPFYVISKALTPYRGLFNSIRLA